MIALARTKDTLTTPYAFRRTMRTAMAKAGADVIVCHLGLTTTGRSAPIPGAGSRSARELLTSGRKPRSTSTGRHRPCPPRTGGRSRGRRIHPPISRLISRNPIDVRQAGSGSRGIKASTPSGPPPHGKLEGGGRSFATRQQARPAVLRRRDTSPPSSRRCPPYFDPIEIKLVQIASPCRIHVDASVQFLIIVTSSFAFLRLRRHAKWCNNGLIREGIAQRVSSDIELSLRRRIEAGEWSESLRFPDERRLASESGVARNTVRAAIERLRAARPGPARSGARHFSATVVRRRSRCRDADAHRRKPGGHDGGPADHRAEGGRTRGDQRESRGPPAIAAAHETPLAADGFELFEQSDSAFHELIFVAFAQRTAARLHAILSSSATRTNGSRSSCAPSANAAGGLLRRTRGDRPSSAPP